ncbi:MAG: 2-hydroxychromene-2-carboxylate isomerase [Rhodobacteraceae bacterium]|nr:MAG: 2-hydroxychromene-2-carboxylate isomerase [Paracoccaceae bacterium]
MPASIDFWFSIGSTYTCLTVLRLAKMGPEAPALHWRPFDVRRIMLAQNNIPFRDKPVKAAYMWRDIERRAQKYGLEVRVPAPYPLAELTLANQIALVGCDEGWCEAYVTETYRVWFVEGLEPGQEPAISRALGSIGQDTARVMALAQSAEIADRLNAKTDAAMALGVFGAPSFVVAGEVFWGDDRLEDALDWAERGRLG